MVEKLKELGFSVLNEVKQESTPRVEVFIKGDCNDADYAESTDYYELSDPEQVQALKEAVEFLKKDDNYSMIMSPHFFWGSDEDTFNMTGEEHAELLDNLTSYFDIPGDSYGYCHTLYYLDFTYIDEKGTRYPLSLGLEDEEHHEVVEIIDSDYDEDCEDDGYTDEEAE